MWGSASGLAITLESGVMFFPEPEVEGCVRVNSQDMSVFKSLNADVYGTSKRACLEAAKKALGETAERQKKIIKQFEEHLEEHNVTLSILDKKLETADFPDTMLEFAEMELV